MKLYDRLLRASAAFTEVELNGFHYDWVEACNVLERECWPKLWSVGDQLREVSGHSLLNPKAPQQIAAIYYGEWGLKHGLKDMGKKKFSHSVADEVRKEIAAGRFTCNTKYKNQLVDFNTRYMRFQKLETIRKSFLEGLIKRVREDGKLYCRFNIGGTATGRTSSSDPNFQNIIREGFEEIPSIRTLFLPSPGNVIVAGDLSQAELRACAKLSGDGNLLSIYRDSSRSLHKERASAFYGADYTKEQYVKSKNINFGVTYLQSAESFAQMYSMSKREAQGQIDSWWESFPTLEKWAKREVWKEVAKGYVESPFGHRRRFYLITEENKGDVLREAVNFKPQNIAAWATVSALSDLVLDYGVRVVATVHDSIVADVPKENAHETAKLMKEVMERQFETQLGWSQEDIPLVADVSIGPNWGELKELELEMAA